MTKKRVKKKSIQRKLKKHQ